MNSSSRRSSSVTEQKSAIEYPVHHSPHYQLTAQTQSASWPETSLTSDQREDTRNEEYTITFEEGNDIYSYTTNGYLEYLEFTPGSKWLLSVNAFGKITDLQSAD